MALCTECKAKIPTISTRRKRVNEALHYLGTYYHNILPLSRINEILEENGFSPATFSQIGHVHEYVEDGTWLSVSYYRMDSGNWEVVAYVN